MIVQQILAPPSTLLRKLAILFAGSVCAFSLTAATYEVSTDVTLQAALSSAASGDVILLATGTYAPLSVTDGRTLIIRAADGATPVIDGKGTARCATLAVTGVETAVWPAVVKAQTAVRLEGLVLRNGFALYGGGAYGGTLVRCRVENCLARYGGAGLFRGRAENTTFFGNHADVKGGAAAESLLSHCTIEQNSALHGGGIAFGSANECTFVANRASFGGATYEATVGASVLRQNQAEVWGNATYGGSVFSSLYEANTSATGEANSGVATVAFATAANVTLAKNSANYDLAGTLGTFVVNALYYGNTTLKGIIDPESRAKRVMPTHHFGGELSSFLLDEAVFANADANNWRILKSSKAFDCGDDALGGLTIVETRVDAAHHMRRQGEKIDLGAYEAPTGDPFQVTVTIEGAGTVTPQSLLVTPGDATTFVAASDVTASRAFLGFYVNGECLSSNSSWTYEPQKGDHIVARFDGLYVDAIAGDDRQNGLASTTAKKTLAAALALESPAFRETICLTSGTYALATSPASSVELKGGNTPTDTSLTLSGALSLADSTLIGLTVTGAPVLTGGTFHRCILKTLSGSATNVTLTSSLVCADVSTSFAASTANHVTFVGATAPATLMQTSCVTRLPADFADSTYGILRDGDRAIDAGTALPVFLDDLDLRGKARVQNGRMDDGATECHYIPMEFNREGLGTFKVNNSAIEPRLKRSFLVDTSLTLTATALEGNSARTFLGFTLPDGTQRTSSPTPWQVGAAGKMTARFASLTATDSASLTQALSRAKAEEVILVASGIYGGTQTIPDGVTIRGIQGETIFTGTISGGRLECAVLRGVTASDMTLNRCLIEESSTLTEVTTFNSIVMAAQLTGGRVVNSTLTAATVSSTVNFVNSIIQGTATNASFTNCLQIAPQYESGSYRLAEAATTAINKGQAVEAVGTLDYYGVDRVLDGTIDIGASEWPAPPYQVTIRRMGWGQVSPLGTIAVPRGEAFTVVVAPDPKHQRTIQSVMLGDVAVTVTNGSYTWIPTANQILTVTFEGLSVNTGGAALQAAIDEAQSGETITVAPGTYDSIVTDNKVLTIRATSADPSKTIIDGKDSKRAATLGLRGETATELIGFTLCNGVANEGGGAFGGTLRQCIVRNNRVTYNGLGAGFSGGRAFNCLLIRNGSSTVARSSGGGAAFAELINCTIADNLAEKGGGIYECTVCNSIIARNTDLAGGASDWYGENVPDPDNCCTPTATGSGGITADPCFVSAERGDYRLREGSPCIDSGSAACDSGDKDLMGRRRVYGSRVDMGAIEWDNPPYILTVTMRGFGLGTINGTPVSYGTALTLEVPRGVPVALVSTSDTSCPRPPIGFDLNGQRTSGDTLSWVPISSDTIHATVVFVFGDLFVGGATATHDTLPLALASVKEGETIHLSAGTIAGDFTIPPRVSILASGAVGDTVLTGTITLAEGARLEGLTVCGGTGVTGAGGELLRCVVRETTGAAAVSGATLKNCFIFKNRGDGLRNGTAYLSTIVENGGTGFAGTTVAHSSVAWGNGRDADATVTATYSCASVPLSGSHNVIPEDGNIAFALPVPSGEDYTPTKYSVCTNAGEPSPSWLTWTIDLAGRSRKGLTRVDIGAFEFLSMIVPKPYAVSDLAIHYKFDSADTLGRNSGNLTSVTTAVGSAASWVEMERSNRLRGGAFLGKNGHTAAVDARLVANIPSSSLDFSPLATTISYYGTIGSHQGNQAVGTPLLTLQFTNGFGTIRNIELTPRFLTALQLIEYNNATVPAVTSEMLKSSFYTKADIVNNSETQMVHLALTRMESRWALYVNGDPLATVKVELGSYQLTSIVLGGTSYAVGSAQVQTDCRIEDFRLYSRAMEAEEILALYNDVTAKDFSPTEPVVGSDWTWFGSEQNMDGTWASSNGTWMCGNFGAPTPLPAGTDALFLDRPFFSSAKVSLTEDVRVGAVAFRTAAVAYTLQGIGTLRATGGLTASGLAEKTLLCPTEITGRTVIESGSLCFGASSHRLAGGVSVGANAVRFETGAQADLKGGLLSLSAGGQLSATRGASLKNTHLFATDGKATFSGASLSGNSSDLYRGQSLVMGENSALTLSDTLNLYDVSTVTLGTGTYETDFLSIHRRGTLIINDGAALMVATRLQLNASQSPSQSKVIQNGGTVTLKGSGTGKNAPLHIGHWNSGVAASYTLKGGELNVPNSAVCIGQDGSGNLFLHGGIANLKGLTTSKSENYAELKTAATLNLVNAPGFLHLCGGTLVPQSAWGTIPSSITLVEGLSTLDLSAGFDQAIRNISLTGAGGLVLRGKERTLTVNAPQAYAGETCVREGVTLLLQAKTGVPNESGSFAGDLTIEPLASLKAYVEDATGAFNVPSALPIATGKKLTLSPTATVIGNLTLAANTTLVLSAPGVILTGALTFNGGALELKTLTAEANTRTLLLTATGGITGALPTVRTSLPGVTLTLTREGNSLYVTSNVSTVSRLLTRTLSSSAATWDTTTPEWNIEGSPTKTAFRRGDRVTVSVPVSTTLTMASDQIIAAVMTFEIAQGATLTLIPPSGTWTTTKTHKRGLGTLRIQGAAKTQQPSTLTIEAGIVAMAPERDFPWSNVEIGKEAELHLSSCNITNYFLRTVTGEGTLQSEASLTSDRYSLQGFTGTLKIVKSATVSSTPAPMMKVVVAPHQTLTLTGKWALQSVLLEDGAALSLTANSVIRSRLQGMAEATVTLLGDSQWEGDCTVDGTFHFSGASASVYTGALSARTVEIMGASQPTLNGSLTCDTLVLNSAVNAGISGRVNVGTISADPTDSSIRLRLTAANVNLRTSLDGTMLQIGADVVFTLPEKVTLTFPASARLIGCTKRGLGAVVFQGEKAENGIYDIAQGTVTVSERSPFGAAEVRLDQVTLVTTQDLHAESLILGAYTTVQLPFGKALYVASSAQVGTSVGFELDATGISEFPAELTLLSSAVDLQVAALPSLRVHVTHLPEGVTVHGTFVLVGNELRVRISKASVLTWNLMHETGTWTTASTSKPWLLSGIVTAFTNGMGTVFASSDNKRRTISISGNVAPSSLILNGGTWTFSGEGQLLGAPALRQRAGNVQWNVLIPAESVYELALGACATIANTVQPSLGTLMGAGTLALSNSALTLTRDERAFEGEILIPSASRLTVSHTMAVEAATVNLTGGTLALVKPAACKQLKVSTASTVELVAGMTLDVTSAVAVSAPLTLRPSLPSTEPAEYTLIRFPAGQSLDATNFLLMAPTLPADRVAALELRENVLTLCIAPDELAWSNPAGGKWSSASWVYRGTRLPARYADRKIMHLPALATEALVTLDLEGATIAPAQIIVPAGARYQLINGTVAPSVVLSIEGTLLIGDKTRLDLTTAAIPSGSGTILAIAGGHVSIDATRWFESVGYKSGEGIHFATETGGKMDLHVATAVRSPVMTRAPAGGGSLRKTGGGTLVITSSALQAATIEIQEGTIVPECSPAIYARYIKLEFRKRFAPTRNNAQSGLSDFALMHQGTMIDWPAERRILYFKSGSQAMLSRKIENVSESFTQEHEAKLLDHNPATDVLYIEREATYGSSNPRAYMVIDARRKVSFSGYNVGLPSNLSAGFYAWSVAVSNDLSQWAPPRVWDTNEGMDRGI
ncbi:MAG: choice-of-anchor Q domain-containing protein, partial [Kiritimatiellia bacterium]